ncbi:MAG TPA: DUF2510 domain-containing protein [Frankiaceae bacterium]|nr:DUF2510 domain-containing protein [Frankiaceae bacterium]
MNVELARLQSGSVPKLCAKTGVPTTLVRRQWALSWNRASFWWLLLGGGAWLVASAVRSSLVRVHLPIAADVRAQYALRRALRVAAVLLLVYLSGGVPYLWLVVTAVGWWAMTVWVRAGWVRVKWNGVFVRLQHAHPDFLEALRAAAAPGLPEWSPDIPSIPVGAVPYQPAGGYPPVYSYGVPPMDSYGYAATAYAPQQAAAGTYGYAPQLVQPAPPPAPAPVPAGPVAGWYADPAGAEAMRYWDGGAWTEHLTAYPTAAGA